MLNEEIIKWCREKWPNRTHEKVEKKLVEELEELIQAIKNKDALNVFEELFDAYAMIVDYCYMNGIKMGEAFEAKKEVMEFREVWGKMPNQEREILRRYI